MTDNMSTWFYRRLVAELSTTSTAASIGLAAACADIHTALDLRRFAERLQITCEARLVELEKGGR